MFAWRRNYVPPLAESGGAEGFTPYTMKFSTVEQTVEALKQLIFASEAELARWNNGPENYVCGFFGRGDYAPPAGFVATVVTQIIQWLEEHPSFSCEPDGAWRWGVMD